MSSSRCYRCLRFFPCCFSRIYRGDFFFLLLDLHCAAPRASLVASLSPVLYSGSTYFFSRSVPVSLSHHRLCSHSPLLRHLLVSLYGSVPHAASFYLLGHSPDRPLSLRPFPGSTFGTVAATSCVTLSAKNTARKHVRPDGEHRSARPRRDVFTDYVNPPITRISLLELLSYRVYAPPEIRPIKSPTCARRRVARNYHFSLSFNDRIYLIGKPRVKRTGLRM